MDEKKVVLGLSDGVDSAVAARILKDQGFEVYGLYLNIAGGAGEKEARRSAEKLGISFCAMDVSDRIEEHVCRPFAEGYLKGETINPCIGCNRNMKFEALTQYADEIGAKWIATGHYSRIENGIIYSGYPDNDQSYMLSKLKRSQVERLLLPLGGMKKEDVREIARGMHLSVAEKPDSREICFIKGETYASWLEKRAKTPGEGDAFYNGSVFSKHEGIHRYTVGQRFGETESGRRLYVSEIHSETNSLFLVLWDDLFKNEITVRDVVWLTDKVVFPVEGQVRARHTRWEMPDCVIEDIGDGRVRVTTKDKLRAPAKGQTAAFYIGNRLIGGGTIDGWR
ncbi:MAG: tRNA 2-thiouridine(34) synthase MnmA [Clostridia bacterium]|nr:tRNA 2-thiouridine(34) synthase MnmA [Clostridia bacterium]